MSKSYVPHPYIQKGAFKLFNYSGKIPVENLL